MKPSLRILTALLLSANLLVLPACTRSKNGDKNSASSSETLRRGAYLLPFDFEQVTELTVAKNDPAEGAPWTAKVARQGEGDDASWRIVSAPDGKELQDRLANRTYIRHLLDTLRTLQYAEDAPEGPLPSYGLASPRFALRWRTPQQPFELLVGTELDSGSYVHLPSHEKTVIARGAALRMLEHLSDFSMLRQKNLLTLPADDVDEMTFFRNGKQVLYAQRETDSWVDAKRRKLKVPAGELLEALAHLKVKDFVDDASSAGSLREKLKKPDYRIEFKDRQGLPTEIRIARENGKIWASESSRKTASDQPAIFELHPETLQHLRKLPKK